MEVNAMEQFAVEALLQLQGGYRSAAPVHSPPTEAQDTGSAATLFFSYYSPETPSTSTAAVVENGGNMSAYNTSNAETSTQNSLHTPIDYTASVLVKTSKDSSTSTSTSEENMGLKNTKASRIPRGPPKKFKYQPEVQSVQKTSDQRIQTDDVIDEEKASMAKQIEELQAKNRSLEEQLKACGRQHPAPPTPPSSNADLEGELNPDVSSDVLKIQQGIMATKRKRSQRSSNSNSTNNTTVEDSDTSDEEWQTDQNPPKRRTPLKRIDLSKARGSELVPIGDGNAAVPAKLLRLLPSLSFAVATRRLMGAVFSRGIMATHSLTGKPSPAFPNKPAKKQLDPKLVNDIIQTVVEQFNVTESVVRTCITTKCADESKMLRTREKKESKAEQENVPPSEDEQAE